MRRFLKRISPKEFMELQLYEQVEPFGELRADYRAAQIASIVHNVSVSEEHQRELETFLLRFEKKKGKVKLTVDQQIALATTIAKVFNARGLNS